MTAAPLIGIDLGGTNVQAAIVSPEGRIGPRRLRQTDAHRGADAVLDTVREMVESLLQEARSGGAPGAPGGETPRCGTVGIAAAGAIDAARGLVLAAPNLGWTDFPLRDRLSERLGLTVVVENDVNAAVFGEYRMQPWGPKDLAAVWIGTGVGGGLVLDGRLYRGALGSAGEFGQTIIRAGDGESVAAPVTVEDLCSRRGMQSEIRRLLREYPDSPLAALGRAGADRIGAPQLHAAWKSRDALALHIVGTAADLLGVAIANLVTLLALPQVIIGGGVAEVFGEPWLDRIRASFRRCVFPPQAADRCRLTLTALAGDAGVIGAALLADAHRG